MYVLKMLTLAILDYGRSSNRLLFSVYNCVCAPSVRAECHMLNRTRDKTLIMQRASKPTTTAVEFCSNPEPQLST